MKRKEDKHITEIRKLVEKWKERDYDDYINSPAMEE